MANRVIEFRGKRHKFLPDDSNEFVYGFLTIEEYYNDDLELQKECIIYVQTDYANHLVAIQVDAETVGQFSGLHDKNGKKIYEGDIVKDVFEGRKGEIIYFAPSWVIVDLNGDDFSLFEKHIEVIGNIHKHLELLK